MALYKIERCPACPYKRQESNPRNSGKCPKCGTRMEYLPKWYYSVEFGGRKIRKAVSADKKLAQAAYSKIVTEIAEGRFLNKEKRIEWHEAAEKLRTHASNLAPDSKRAYERALNKLTDFFSGQVLNSIRPELVEEYRQIRLSEGAANTTINHEYPIVFKLMYKLCGLSSVRFNYIRALPTTSKQNFLEEKEIKALLGACKMPRTRMMCMIALNTGLRKHGAVSLAWTEIDFKKKMIRKKVKGGKEVIVPLNQTLEAELLKWKREQKVLSKFVIHSSHTKKQGMHFDKRSNMGFTDACNEAGILRKYPDFRFHDLRHTFASQFLASNPTMKGVKILQKILGHSTISMTMDIYAHLLKDDMHEAMNNFDSQKGVSY